MIQTRPPQSPSDELGFVLRGLLAYKGIISLSGKIVFIKKHSETNLVLSSSFAAHFNKIKSFDCLPSRFKLRDKVKQK